MDFGIVNEDEAIFVLEDKRNGLYFNRFGYDSKTVVTDRLDEAKKFQNKSNAADYIITHQLEDHYEVEAITV